MIEIAETLLIYCQKSYPLQVSEPNINVKFLNLIYRNTHPFKANSLSIENSQ